MSFRVFFSQFDGWILEKMKIATDESYQDPANLLGKLQRHKAFEAELSSNKDGIDRINAVEFSYEEFSFYAFSLLVFLKRQKNLCGRFFYFKND